ncbi:MAG: protein translocase subunit SecD [Candidatus Omnitrophica bacterium]|nr:protein translocase subunit SecD [Candidatus Omnitrophota bacterium]
MDKYYKWKVLLIIAVVAFSIWRAYPPNEKINLGLDLQGGMQLLLQIEIDKVPVDVREDVADRATEIIRNRIDEFGVREPVISKQGKDQVVVQLPGVTDRKRAKEIVGKTALLEFKLVEDNTELIKKADQGNVPEGYEYKRLESRGSKSAFNPPSILLHKDAALTGDHLVNASVGFDQYGQPIVQLQFDKKGADIFDKLTYRNIGKQLAIVLDGNVHSAPVIRDRIPSGQAQISGNFTVEEASDLALVLRAGALPAPVKIIEERTVGPSLGRDSIEKGIRATILGGLIVFIFMPLYYLISGFITDIGLVIYAIIVLGAMAAFKASLTLPGIAGFILSIGMAVDANVLISERMREEIATGKTPRAAISAGYHRAFSAILDSNVTTLITSVILFIFGTGPVKGFAVTLTIGIIASMFSALLVTRVVFDFLTRRNANLNLKMFQLFHFKYIPFLKGRFLAYGFSAITLILGVMAIVVRGRENFGVEFIGGSLIQVQFKDSVPIGRVRSALEKEGVTRAVIQRYGDPSENQFIVKITGSDTASVEAAFGTVSGPDAFEILRVDQVGPMVSGDLRKKALWAVIWSCVGILIYLALRFEWKFSLAAVFAIIHDSVFTFGVYALSGREINLPIIAAILTILGFSVNDTIVTFDRVRDNLKLMKKTPFLTIVETSINQTLSRTILTSLTVIFTVLALFLVGGSAINDFAFTLLVGFLVGIYSTIFVATSLVVDWKAH